MNNPTDAEVLKLAEAVQQKISTMDKCGDCGMSINFPYEYHPYAACLMFKSCKDGKTVRGHLNTVRAHAVKDFQTKLKESNDG